MQRLQEPRQMGRVYEQLMDFRRVNRILIWEAEISYTTRKQIMKLVRVRGLLVILEL